MLQNRGQYDVAVKGLVLFERGIHNMLEHIRAGADGCEEHSECLASLQTLEGEAVNLRCAINDYHAAHKEEFKE